MSHLNAAQVEQLKLIGAELSEYRQQIKMSLDEVSIKTYIPTRILLAVEKAQAENLPEPVFVQGFIRRFGDAVGVNGNLLAERFVIDRMSFSVEPTGSLSGLPTPKEFANNNNGSIATTTKPVYSNRSTPARPAATDTTTKLKPFARKQFPINWRLLTAAIAGLGVIGLGTWQGPSLLAEVQKNLMPQKSAQKVTQKTALKTQHSTAKTPAKTGSKALDASHAKVFKATLSLSNESWLSIKVDGKSDFSGIAEKGFQKSWNVKQNILLNTGNAGAVSVSLNNQKPQVVGQSGEVKTVTISANGLHNQ